MGETDELRAMCADAAGRAQRARRVLGLMTSGERTALLNGMGAGIRDHRGAILDANAQDMAAGSGLSAALRDRLLLDAARVEGMARAVESIAGQADPVGSVIEGRELANGIRLEKRRIPLGVVAVIYESRPNVTSDAAALCVRAGNGVVLKGGRESRRSNLAIVGAMHGALEGAGVGDAVVYLDTTDRAAVGELVRLDGLVDLAVPRGGPGLIKAVSEAATVPVVKHDAGVCHVYVDEHITGMEEVAERIVVNAKTHRPGVCNSAETLLVHRGCAAEMMGRLCEALQGAGVEVRGCAETARLCGGVVPADDADWGAEYLDLVIAARVVGSVEEAAAHISEYGSGHTECIVTGSTASARRFVALVDSASVMVNCSTRFADGGEYGLGAEIGISTDRLHARGPMGAFDLMTFQWVLEGDGQIRR